MLDALKFIIENAIEILFIISIIVGAVQTFRSNRKSFWNKLKETAASLINEAESMDFKPGEGADKKDFVIEKLLEEFGGKFALISRKKLEDVVEPIVTLFNTFNDLN